MDNIIKMNNKCEGFTIEGTIKIYCGDIIEEIPFKSIYQNNYFGSYKKDFIWKSDRKTSSYEFGDVFVEIPDAMLKMQEDHLCNYDLKYHKKKEIRNNE
jgi:hypothetical protein